jgi:hypothetical protein
MSAASVVRTLTVLIAIGLPAALATAAPRVDLELVTEPGFPITGAQEWITALKNVGAGDIRIRAARSGDQWSIANRGTEQSPAYQVVGILSADSVLRLPGGSFRMGDRAGISTWIKKLQEGGEEGLSAKPGAFGLTGKQLVAVHEQLAVPVSFETKGKRIGDVARGLVRALPLEVAVDAAAQRAFAADQTPVVEELQGVSCGTALAAILRPLGLVFLPEKQSGSEVRLLITDVRSAEQSWPVGWPPDKAPLQVMPDFFKTLNVEIEDTPLAEALPAIQGRLKVPFLFDHNSLARHRIDPTQVKVSIAPGNSYYKKILDTVLSQAKLKSEIRVDEAGQPFIWISTVFK